MNERPFRVLAIDGGGVRGIIPALILQEIETITKSHISELFDLIVGTSTGGIIALGLCAPNIDKNGHFDGTPKYRACDLVEFYQSQTKEIFSDTGWTKGVFGSKYNSEGIEKALKQKFGNISLGESICPVLIPSYCTEHRRIVLFKSRKAIEKKHRNILMWQAARATSAAPVYFPPYRLEVTPEAALNEAKTEFSLIDGGVLANNPTMVGLKEAKQQYRAKELIVVSIGTGTDRKHIPYADIEDAGIKGWATKIIDILFSGASEVTEKFAAEIVAGGESGLGRYYRFQLDLGSEYTSLDDYNIVSALQKLTTTKIKERQDELFNISNILLENKNTLRPLQYSGVVENYYSEKGKGFGFINTKIGSSTEKIWAHLTSIMGNKQNRFLVPGENVELDIIRQSDQRLSALRVRKSI